MSEAKNKYYKLLKAINIYNADKLPHEVIDYVAELEQQNKDAGIAIEKAYDKIKEIEQQNKEYKEKNDLLTNRNDSLEDDKQIFINECNELRRKKIELKKQNKEYREILAKIVKVFPMDFTHIEYKDKALELLSK